jgi:succinate dehydrogenase / fumarate reductase cytochrome b subunit
MKKWWSSVGKKLITAISGLVLFLFIIVHLGGNLTMFVSADLFNSYAHHLEALGPLLYVAEIGLIIFFLFHVVSAVSVQIDKWRARPDGYEAVASKGGPSKKTLASRTMIVTGVVLFVFVILHVRMFKFGPGPEAGYVTEVHGQQMRDLYRLVVEEFKRPGVVIAYVAVMLFLGFHLRHGFWSALQSLGAMSPRWSPAIYTLGLIFAILLAGGFLALPVWMYFCVPVDRGGL